MSERDHELVAARRSCTLLSRDEMLEGKVPTTATTASLVAAAEVQEAIKLLHRDRLGEPSLAGKGFHFVGLTHDSYMVAYQAREDCMSHDTYDIDGAIPVDANATFGELLAEVREDLGADAVIELEQEIAVSATCGACGAERTIQRPVDELDAGDGLCDSCGEAWRLEFAHSVDDGSALLDKTALEIGLPPHDFVVGRSGMVRRCLRLGEHGEALSALAAVAP